MIALVEGSVRQKTPNEIALNILLASLTIVFLLVIVALQPMASFSGSPQSVVVLVALLVCLIPTTIGALVSAIGVAGMDRLVQRNVLAMSGRAVEAAGDVSTLLLDKTGTITFGNRQAARLIAAPGVDPDSWPRPRWRPASPTRHPRGGRSSSCAAQTYHVDGTGPGPPSGTATVVEFTARTRMSGIDMPQPRRARDGTGRDRSIRKGAVSAVSRGWSNSGGTVPAESLAAADEISSDGGTPLLVAESGRVLGVIHLKDVVKPGIAERFAELRRMGIRTVMITGDTELTAQCIAREAGVDDFLAEATPEDKLAYIRARAGPAAGSSR